MSQAQRYARYVEWCRQLGTKAAPFGVWVRELGKVREIDIRSGREYTTVLVGAK